MWFKFNVNMREMGSTTVYYSRTAYNVITLVQSQTDTINQMITVALSNIYRWSYKN